MKPNFQRIRGMKDYELEKDYELDNEKHHFCVPGVEITHIGVYAGKVGYFFSDHEGDYFATSGRKFFKKPEKAVGFQFPYFKKTPEGFFYGKLEFTKKEEFYSLFK